MDGRNSNPSRFFPGSDMLPSSWGSHSLPSSWILWYKWIIALFVLGGTLVLITTPDRGATAQVFLGFGLGTMGWIGALSFSWTRREIFYWIGLGILCRILWFLVPPLLSDDWARYLWDGLIAHRGGNPFEQLPSAISEQSPDLFRQMNSPDYYTVYPPVAQWIFRLSVWLGEPYGIPGMIAVLRSVLFLGDLLAIGLLYRLLPAARKSLVLIYALAPLALAESSGNIHLEGLAIGLTLLGIYGLERYQPFKMDDTLVDTQSNRGWAVLAALGFAAAILVKLHPILLLMVLPFRLGWKKGVGIASLTILVVLVAFIPFQSPVVWSNFSQSLDLYFRTFEFNGGLYSMFRWLSIQLSGYNQIALVGPLLGGIAALSMIWLVGKNKPTSTEKVLQTAFWLAAIHQLLATTVHPWYVLPLLAWSAFSNYRFGLAWAALIPLTYLAYSGGSFHQPIGMITLEYAVLFGYMLWEFLANRQRPLQTSKQIR